MSQPGSPPCRRITRRAVTFIVLGVLLAAACVLRLIVGESFGWPGSGILEIRAQRLLIGVTIGAALAVAGVLLQALLRNPLASPYILGISTGAALGVMIAVFAFGSAAAVVFGIDQLAALIGALVTMAVVYLLAQKRGWIDPLGLLLVGVIMNAINGAAIMFLNYLTPHGAKPQITLWMMGYFNENVGWPALGVVAAASVAGIGLAWSLGRAMDIATLSDAEAESVGLNLRRLRLGLFGVAGLLTAGSIVLAGPIAFVGLICPHIVRLAIGPAHRPLVIGSAMAGAALIVGADVAVKALDLGQGLMPIGIITALVGGPVFVALLRPQLGRTGVA